ncbi:MAG: DoxX family protein [Ignavibacteria bacterium]|jgi:putative oxidoreductase|nr:DoxX family protein [Ignavibacteria bacterium]MCU7505053.1 DoxX family protein [Ignavibacteria bacterium]MCU7515307.1 DoxX family protein [Ignavibacteria bacterium]
MKLLFRPWVNTSIVILLLRIILGIVFIAHGGQKVLGWFGGRGLAATVDMFVNNMHIPAVLAYMDAFTEFLGGILVLIGLLTRISSAGIAVVMIVAIARVHAPNGFFNPAGYEFPLTLLVIAVVLFLYGSGRYGIDYFWESRTRQSGITY